MQHISRSPASDDSALWARVFWLFLAALMLVISSACIPMESPEDQIEDAAIAGEIKAKLAAELNATTLANVSVDVTNGAVTLSGRVASAEEKHRAEQITRGIDGVMQVRNNLQVGAVSPEVPRAVS
jgi:BON domain